MTTANAMMLNTCTLYGFTEAQSTGSAGVTHTLSLVGAITSCSIQQTGGVDGIYEGRAQGLRSFNVFFPYSVTVAVGYLIKSISGVAGVGSGVVLRVTSDGVDHSGRQAYVMVTAEELNQ